MDARKNTNDKMKNYYIDHTPRDRYIVMQKDTESGESRPVRHFGEWYGYALHFAKDCNGGELPPHRIDQLCETYTDIHYAYLGNGKLRRWRHGKLRNVKITKDNINSYR